MNVMTLLASVLPVLGIYPDLKITVWNILSGILVALIVFFVLTRDSAFHKPKKKPVSTLMVFTIAAFFAGVVGIGSYIFFLPSAEETTPVISYGAVPGQTFPVVNFPVTGTVPPVPLSQVLAESVQSFYTTPKDALITLLLLLSVISLSAAAILNIRVRKRVEKDLESAEITARTVYQDLQIEAQTLAESKAKEEAILASIADGIIAIDKGGTIILMNETAEKMLGYTSRESVGKPWNEILHRADQMGNPLGSSGGAIEAALKDATTTVTTVTTAIYYIRKDGTKFPVSRTVSPVVLAGNVIGAINIFRDITREKGIDRAKTEFVSLASHQLRTPIAAINWYAQMLLAGEVGGLNEKQKKYLEEIYHGNQRMIDLVNTLLSVSRIELGTLLMQPEPTDVALVSDDVLEELQVQIDDKKLIVTREYEKDMPRITTDAKLVRIIFQNLLSNSVAYTAPEGKIFVRLRREDARTLVEVSDSGYGIPQNARSKIYTKFFRADNARAIKPDGTGLGLYITKSVVETLGGTIDFTSQEGAGTTFRVMLPSIDTMKKDSQMS